MGLRRPSFALALVVVVAGCIAGVPTDSPALPGDGAGESVTPKPYPDRPENLTRETVVRFAEAYERAYKWNRELTDATVEVSVNPVRTEVMNETATGYVVHLEVAFSKTVRSDGGKMVGDGFYTVNHLINETTILRAQTGGQARPGPDPRDGTVLEG